MKQMFGWMAVAAFWGIALAGLVGCKPSEAIRQGAVLGNGRKPVSLPLDPATLGGVTGTVRFTGKPPARVRIDMSQDPACSLTPEDNYSEQYVVHDSKLANAYVYIKSGPGVAMTAPSTTTAPVVMNQVGCKYVPHVVALMRGGAVEFRNSDMTMHNVHVMPVVIGGKETDVSQGPSGAPQLVQFKDPELMVPVRCNNHPWMNAFINVADTPFFAVTDTEGNFKIENLPAGNYVIAVLHEKMGEQTMNITVKPQNTAKANFTYALK